MQSEPNNASRLMRAWMAVAVLTMLGVSRSSAQTHVLVGTSRGLRLLVVEENILPTLKILLPGEPDSSQGIVVVFPEHVTVRERGKTEAEHLYLWQPGRWGRQPAWRQVGQSLEYEMDLKNHVHLHARATLEPDGVRFHYDLVSRSNVDYEMVQAITDPRLYSAFFHDMRLERTYVHHREGFDLLASETPGRLTMPEKEWLPCRYRVPFTWPVVPRRVEKKEDGITWYNKSRQVDQPFIATVSQNGKWIAATCTGESGNVWTNPELTCQHADPSTSLQAGGTASLDVKTFVFQGTLEEVLQKVKQQRKQWGY
jgi:hypothetical protein